MFYQDEDVNSSSGLIEDSDALQPRTSLTYEEVVKDLIHDEKQYLRDLHMIIKVFREEIAKLTNDHKVNILFKYLYVFFSHSYQFLYLFQYSFFKDLEDMFSNIMDIYELTITLLGSLEDMVEISEEKQIPAVGSCFEELAEVIFRI